MFFFFFLNIVDDNKSVPSFGFGFRFYYWSWYAHNEDIDDVTRDGSGISYRYCDLYICAKYSDLKCEILSKIKDVNTFNTLQKKAIILFKNTKNIKSLKANTGYFSPFKHYGIPDDTPISLNNILCILVYTDLTSLSFCFSESFRKSAKAKNFKNIKNINAKYYWLAKGLREAVECYGTDARWSDECKISTFYHGTSYLYFSSFSASFCCPTSTTKQIEVAMLFIDVDKNNGIILNLHHDGYRSTMFMNVSFLSSYSNEDERLFCGGYRPLRFSSIKVLQVNGWRDYRKYITPIKKLHNIIKDDYSKDRCGSFSSSDISILSSLLSSSCSSFPLYIVSIFNKFTKTIQKIKINLNDNRWSGDKDYYFPWSILFFVNFFVSSSNDIKILNIQNITKTFTNCKKITYYKFDQSINITSSYLLYLLSHLEYINLSSLSIIIENVNFNVDIRDPLKMIFYVFFFF